MCDRLLKHKVPSWLEVHITDAVSAAVFDHVGIIDLQGFRRPQSTFGRGL